MNWYETLQVIPTADPDVVEAAYRTLVQKYEAAGDTAAAADQLGQVRVAYEVLGDPDRRSQYDRELAGGTEPPPSPGNLEPAPATAADAHAAPGPGSTGFERPGAFTAAGTVPRPVRQKPNRRPVLLAGLAALVVLFLGVLAVGGLLLWRDRDDGGMSYPVDREDDAYDLEAMALVDDDMPEGMGEQRTQSFTNEEWAEAVDEENPEAKKTQLDAQGRIRGFVKILSREQEEVVAHLGEPYQYTTHSTLFTDEVSAKGSLSKFCDVPVDEKNPLEEFEVVRIGDEAVGFRVTEELPNFGKSVDTVVCFRTGRLVHAVVQSGLQGTENRDLAVSLAKQMLAHVNAAFKGESGEDRAATEEAG